MKILFVSLGCDKNLVDSEVMLGLLQGKGYEITNEEKEADIIVINTCCFINDAKEESINTILEMARWKEEGNLKALIVSGCLAQRYQEEIKKELPEVDAILGTTSLEKIVPVIEETLKGRKVKFFDDINYLSQKRQKRVLTTGGHYSYLKIAEGCDKHCTYCIIPAIRGRYRSVSMAQLLEEAEELAKNGVKELILVAQETTLYGMDRYGKKMLPELLKKLCKIEGLHWIRLLYCYPEEITEELIQVIKEEKKICHYLDMPIQHASDRILRRMGRHTSKKELREKIEKIRKEIPDIVLRTTLISGFPGETTEEHEELAQFVNDMEFERLGVFAYSPEENTPAAELDGQIDEEKKEERRQELMELQQEIVAEFSENQIGKSLEVFIEGRLQEEEVYIGRTYMDAPGVDGYLFLQSDRELLTGDFVKVTVTKAKEYDLYGELEK